MKKNDLIIYFNILLLFLLSILLVSSFSAKGELVKVYVDKKLLSEYPISEDGSHTVNGVDGVTVQLTVSNGSVNVNEATCKDKLCERTGHINKTNEAIICLPGRIVISIDSSEEAEYDSISR